MTSMPVAPLFASIGKDMFPLFFPWEFDMLRRILSVALMLVVCSTAVRGEEAATAAKPSHPTFEKLKKLAGTWVEADANGKPTDKVVSVVKLTAGGSAIQETIFPGQEMEMVSVYHLDKGDVLMTHYCVIGNQPRMKADPNSPPNQIRWKFAGGTNLDPAKDTHMHSSTVTFLDDDHIEIEGEAWENGKPSPDHCGMMKLVRKK